MAKFKSTPLSQKLNRDVFFQTSPDLPRIIEVDLVKLRANPDQPRRDFNQETLQELADSIEQHGLIQPIAVARDPENAERFIIVAGERRFRAFQLLARETVPAIITSGAPDEIALIENIQREALHPLDEAVALARLMERHGYTQEEVGKVVGKARNTVTSILRLNTLPEQIKEECPTSDISKSTLIEIARIDTEEEQLALWEQVKHGGITVREARATKKSSPSVRDVRAVPARTLEAGNRFVGHLRKVSPGDLAAEPLLLTKLKTLRDQISGILLQLSENEEKMKDEKFEI